MNSAHQGLGTLPLVSIWLERQIHCSAVKKLYVISRMFLMAI